MMKMYLAQFKRRGELNFKRFFAIQNTENNFRN